MAHICSHWEDGISRSDENMDLAEHREYGGWAGTCQLGTLACTRAPGHSGDLSDSLQPRWVPPQPEVGIYPSCVCTSAVTALFPHNSSSSLLVPLAHPRRGHGPALLRLGLAMRLALENRWWMSGSVHCSAHRPGEVLPAVASANCSSHLGGSAAQDNRD